MPKDFYQELGLGGKEGPFLFFYNNSFNLVDNIIPKR